MGQTDKKDAKKGPRSGLLRAGGRAIGALWRRMRRARGRMPQAARTALFLLIAALVLMGPQPRGALLPIGWPLSSSSREAAGSDDLRAQFGASDVARLSVKQVAMAWPDSASTALRVPVPEPRVRDSGATAGRPNGASIDSVETVADVDGRMEPLRAQPAFHAPIAGTVDGAFGWFRHETFQDWRFRDGLSLRINPSASPVVRAAQAGRVIRVGTSRQLAIESGRSGGVLSFPGLVVHVEHAGGWETHYMGLAEVYVREGDQVTTGSTLGRVNADSGSGGATHLGFAIYHSGEAVDPSPLLTP